MLEGDLLNKIEESSVECFAIKEIIHKLHKLGPNSELLAFLLEFGPIFETLSHNIRKRTEANNQKSQESRLHQEELNSLKVSQQKISDLEAQAATAEKELAGWDTNIQQWNEEIRFLQLKIENAETQKGLI